MFEIKVSEKEVKMPVNVLVERVKEETSVSTYLVL